MPVHEREFTLYRGKKQNWKVNEKVRDGSKWHESEKGENG